MTTGHAPEREFVVKFVGEQRTLCTNSAYLPF
jgi:hypothetical protein